MFDAKLGKVNIVFDEIIGFESLLPHLPPSDIASFKCRQLITVLRVYSAKRLSRGVSLYKLLNDWLHRSRPHSTQEPTVYEADALSTAF